MNYKTNKKIAYPEFFVSFIVMFIFSLATFIGLFVYNIVNYNEDDIVMFVILLITLLAIALMWPILGINIGVFDIVVFNSNDIEILRLGKLIRKVAKSNIKNISVQIVGKGKAIVFDFSECEADTGVCLKKQYKSKLCISHYKKRLATINSWYFEEN